MVKRWFSVQIRPPELKTGSLRLHIHAMRDPRSGLVCTFAARRFNQKVCFLGLGFGLISPKPKALFIVELKSFLAEGLVTYP